MSDLINLNRARKSKAKAAESAQARENRVRFGLTKAQKEILLLEQARTQRKLDGSKQEN
jgi:Domain of unknown function (DUF4169)